MSIEWSHARQTEVCIRNHAAINKEAGLKLDQIRVLAEGLGKLTDSGIPPTVNRYLEWRSECQAGHEATDGREANRAMYLGKL